MLAAAWRACDCVGSCKRDEHTHGLQQVADAAGIGNKTRRPAFTEAVQLEFRAASKVEVGRAKTGRGGGGGAGEEGAPADERRAERSKWWDGLSAAARRGAEPGTWTFKLHGVDGFAPPRGNGDAARPTERSRLPGPAPPRAGLVNLGNT
eukprot:gene6118-17742_t